MIPYINHVVLAKDATEGLDEYDLYGLTPNKVYTTIGILQKPYIDGSSSICFLLTDDFNCIVEKGISLFEVSPYGEPEIDLLNYAMKLTENLELLSDGSGFKLTNAQASDLLVLAMKVQEGRKNE